jgi:hypothetical protein
MKCQPVYRKMAPSTDGPIVEAKMLDRKRNLNKLIRLLELADARKARRIKPSQMTNRVDHRSATPARTPKPEMATPSHLTDTEVLARKIGAEMVRDAQAAFAAVVAELNASQTHTAPHEFDDSQANAEESDEAIAGQRLIQANRVGEA